MTDTPGAQTPFDSRPKYPKIGDIVHYVSRGSADGFYPSACRAAVVTKWATDSGMTLALAVFNPTGILFVPAAPYHGATGEYSPDTWHWPEEV